MTLFRCLHALGLLIVFILFSAGTITAQEESVRPGVNDTFKDAKIADWVERFEREGREVYDLREKIVEACQLRPGMSVADVGVGTGLFTRLFSPKVGSGGKVYAVDITEEFINNIKAESKEKGLNNVVGIVCTDKSAELPADSVDLAFICDTYHHFEYPLLTMQSLHRALRPGGKVVVIDFRRVEGESSDWVMDHVRAGQEVFIKEIESTGFKLVEERKFLKENYLLRFERVEAAP